ncbi:MAG: hypothetical protein IT294_10150 [Deltaproteobacteria bacterium]|nr:hypothetical protein [Deltaproteobacteria bacterium]
MLSRIDRVQVAVADRRTAALPFVRLLDAAVAGEDAVAPLAARRTTLAAGRAVVELLEPDGAGPVADHLATAGPGLFAAGVATHDLDALRHRFIDRRVDFADTDRQVFLAPAATGIAGLRCVVSALRDAPAAPGLVSHLYEATLLVAEWEAAACRVAELFALAPERFCPITSEEYGYRGTLTMFDPRDRLDRIEVITPYDRGKTMGRFMTKRGPSLYMCFAEAPDLALVRARLREHAPRDWTGSADAPAPDTLFIHPKALGGLMMGVSRTSVGWTWSGHPERVVPG